jgi:hypothetical protein
MKVYHLHLPRTSGVFLRNQLRLENSICGHHFKIDPEDFKKVDYAMGHYGSEPIKYADYSFAILRDPVERTISYFKYIKEHLYTGLDVVEVIDLYLNDPRMYNSVDNLSNKFLTGVVDFELYNKNINYSRIVVENGWYLKSYAKSYEESIQKIKDSGINLLYFNDLKLYDKISEIYGIKIDKSQMVNHNGVSWVNASKNYDIPKSYYNILKNINKIDMEIYESFNK